MSVGSAEILCIGTELLLGEITNTNAQFLAQELALLGIPHYFQTVVGDNIPRVHQALSIAQQRNRLILVTGGLGPTPDDLTHEALATFFQVPLVEHPQLWGEITRKYGERGVVPSPSNRKQTLLPQGAQVLTNSSGSAPGIIWQPDPTLTILTFPGVPSEMQQMWREVAVPYLKSQGWGAEMLISQTLRHWGITESLLAERIGSLFDSLNPTVAPYAGQGEVRIRVTAKAASVEAARTLLDPMVAQLQAIGGNDYYGSDDHTLASVVGQHLRHQGQTLAVAESCTGGLLGELITAVPGSSAYFQGGVMAYDNRVKVNLLKVDPDVLAQQGAVSEAVACQMAAGIQDQLGTDWALSITGVAGPEGGSEEKPVGLVWIGLATPQKTVSASKHLFSPRRGRDGIRYLSAQTALDRLRRQFLPLVSSDK